MLRERKQFLVLESRLQIYKKLGGHYLHCSVSEGVTKCLLAPFWPYSFCELIKQFTNFLKKKKPTKKSYEWILLTKVRLPFHCEKQHIFMTLSFFVSAVTSVWKGTLTGLHWVKNHFFIHKLPRIWCLKNVNFVKKWVFENVNFVKNEILKMCILWKNEIFKMWIFG